MRRRFSIHAYSLWQVVLVSTLITTPALSLAQEVVSIVYRDASGELTVKSKQHAQTLIAKARKQGTVRLWVTLSIDYDLSELTREEATAQQREVARAFEQVLAPLVLQRKVVGLSRPMPIVGPGCGVTATAAGVGALIRDKRVLHLVERLEEL